MTTILTLKSEFENINVFIGIIINLLLVFIVLKSSGWIQSKIGLGGEAILRKVFGIVLLAIAVKILKANLGM